MPIIEPFKGLRYDTQRVGSLSRVVTPPYDVISPEGQQRYYRLHPFKFVRVVFGKAAGSDTPRRNQYSRAKETLEDWIRGGILKFDSKPCLYPYLQEYRLNGRRHRRWGVVALVRLDSPRIYPHEETREGPKRDRYRLLETVQASLSPIFGLIPDARGGYERFIRRVCRTLKPVAIANVGGVRHRLWKNSDPGWHRELKERMASKDLVIADGHHRFEAALAFRNAQKKKDPRYSPRAPYNFAMFYLAAAGKEEPGLLPTHRLLKRFPRQALKKLEAISQLSSLRTRSSRKRGSRSSIKDFEDDLRVDSRPRSSRGQAFRGNDRGFNSLKRMGNRLRRLATQGKIGLGLYTGNGDKAYLLEAPTGSAYGLDVEWLHREVLPEHAGSGAEVTYTQDLLFAHHALRRNQAQALFLVQPPPLKEIFRRARARLRMPGKTTYFHPKPLAGLVEYVWGQPPKGHPAKQSVPLGDCPH